MKILIVEDNEILSNNIKTFLGLENIEAVQVFSGAWVNYELTTNTYDLVILDIWLPDVDGISVSKKIRESGKNIPILMLTARNTKQDKMDGFSAWADDYLTKPFDYDELVMRIRALVRRNYSIKSASITIGDIEILLDAKKVYQKEQEIHLSSLEIDLLVYLVRNRGKIISKEELLDKVWWEYDEFNMSRTVDVYIWYLRKKLWKELIETARWEWYIIHDS